MRSADRIAASLLALTALAAGIASGQSLYKYQDENGDWVYSDRPPAGAESAEVRDLPTGEAPPRVRVTSWLAGRAIRFSATNEFHAPVEVIIALDELTNVGFPPPDQPLRWIVDPRSDQFLMELPAIEDNVAPAVEYRYLWLPGDPRAQHRPTGPYRVPFAVASAYPVSQAFPIGETHRTPDSYYAVDIAMPVGTDIYAARAGTVFEVASTNFRGGLDPQRDGASANIVRILHDDGTHAVYAHLNWNTIRVRPGDRVARGEYIADSGNTGFSSGPHLHFAVMLNRGMRLESVPVVFEGPDATPVTPATGATLVAY